MTYAPTRRAHRAAAPRTARFRAAAVGAAALLGLAGCATGAPDASSDDGARTVTLVVHDSFPNDEFAAAASAATGFDVEVVTAGDGGELTNKLVLTAGAPIADAFYGVDNTFASRLVDADAVEPYTPADLPESAAALAVDDLGSLTAVDQGATCVNIDTAWFADHDLDEPETYEDLADPAYADLTVLLDPTASSTGASFLVGTVAAFGESGYADYWERLVDNGARIEQGWSDAYNGQFTQGGGDGTRPIVVSYSSSPAFTVTEDGSATTTRALLGTCSTQVEYAGVLAGAEHPEGARAVVDYLVSEEFQSTIADSLYMYPSDDTVALPDAWAEFAPLPAPGEANDLTAAEIEAGREGWLEELAERIGL